MWPNIFATNIWQEYILALALYFTASLKVAVYWWYFPMQSLALQELHQCLDSPFALEAFLTMLTVVASFRCSMRCPHLDKYQGSAATGRLVFSLPGQASIGCITRLLSGLSWSLSHLFLLPLWVKTKLFLLNFELNNFIFKEIEKNFSFYYSISFNNIVTAMKLASVHAPRFSFFPSLLWAPSAQHLAFAFDHLYFGCLFFFSEVHYSRCYVTSLFEWWFTCLRQGELAFSTIRSFSIL